MKNLLTQMKHVMRKGKKGKSHLPQIQLPLADSIPLLEFNAKIKVSIWKI